MALSCFLILVFEFLVRWILLKQLLAGWVFPAVIKVDQTWDKRQEAELITAYLTITDNKLSINSSFALFAVLIVNSRSNLKHINCTMFTDAMIHHFIHYCLYELNETFITGAFCFWLIHGGNGSANYYKLFSGILHNSESNLG